MGRQGEDGLDKRDRSSSKYALAFVVSDFALERDE